MECQICTNLDGLCNLHKPKETPKERVQRKGIFIARVTALNDSPKIRREAEELFEEKND